jgi:hypothetical protein
VLIKLSPPAASATANAAALMVSADSFSVTSAAAEKTKRIAETSVDQTVTSSSSNLYTSTLNLLLATASTRATPDLGVTSDSSSDAAANTAAIDAVFATLEYVNGPKLIAKIALAI